MPTLPERAVQLGATDSRTPSYATAAAVVATDATFATVLAERTMVVPEVEPYRPGESYRRELPPLRAVLDGIAGLGAAGGGRCGLTGSGT